MEELLPIVAKLTEKYTSKESTSISYERARQLMEAVVYCIEHSTGENQLVFGKISAKQAYQCGYENVQRLVKEARLAYNRMIVDFQAYGNENYNDTVTKALPGFFKYYDVRFCPQDTIITMDYPTLSPVMEKSGIDAVTQYITYIAYEQRFLKVFPEEYVVEVLVRYQPDYQKHFFNICRIMLRHVLVKMIISVYQKKNEEQDEYEILKKIVLSQEKKELKQAFTRILERILEEQFDNDKGMLEYLLADMEDFIAEFLFNVTLGKKCVVKLFIGEG